MCHATSGLLFHGKLRNVPYKDRERFYFSKETFLVLRTLTNFTQK